MKNKVILIIALLAIPAGADTQDACIFEVVSYHETPVIKKGDPGTENNKYGFEGGRVLKINGSYHLFTAEMIDDPFWVKMKLSHWKSDNGINFTRISTLYESSGDFTGTDPRAAVWAPMPVFDEKRNLWNLFYASYRCKPNTETSWLNDYDGRIWHAVSTKTGVEGIDGPYKDLGVILQPGPESDSWEGLQGVDSFFPYQINDKWYAFYGSAQTQNRPCKFWGVGLAAAEELNGPWKRLTSLNPIPIDGTWVENPIVTKLKDGSYIALFDGGPRESFAYTTSKDGIHWEKGTSIDLQSKVKKWWHKMRTPLGLIPEGNNEFTVFYTALTSPMKQKDTYGCVGMVRLKLKDPNNN